MTRTDEIDILRTVAERLESAGIGYMVTGSIAMNYYATPRMTRDIDIVIDLAPEQVDEVVRRFERDFYIEKDTVRDAVRRRSMFNIIHRERVDKIDLIVGKESAYARTAFRRRHKVSVAGFGVYLIAPEDLIVSKLDWARESHSEMQLMDVRNLLDSVKDLDREYVAHWVGALRLDDIWNEVGG